jgi:hypothetical protein
MHYAWEDRVRETAVPRSPVDATHRPSSNVSPEIDATVAETSASDCNGCTMHGWKEFGVPLCLEVPSMPPRGRPPTLVQKLT